MPQVRFDAPDPWTARYNLALANGARLIFVVASRPDALGMRLSWEGDVAAAVDSVELVFPFEPETATTSIISERWTEDGTFLLPAIVSAPDLGQMLVTCAERPDLTGRIEGSRKDRWVTVTFELPVGCDGSSLELRFSPVVLPLPAGFTDAGRWQKARRGWFNFIQLSCGASGGGAHVTGVWANNVLSDPVSSVLYMLADATLLVPELAPGVRMAPLLRRAVEYWLDHKTDPDGLVAYTAGGRDQNVMDANPSVIIGAWAYVTASNDRAWLERRIADIEFLSRYMESRDVDGDGLVESKQSGNSGSRPPRDPDCACDCYCSGHKNAYVNALAYRAWQGLAALEAQLGRHDRQARYLALADRLRAAFRDAFYNPDTGWLGFWRSQDGKLHDLHMDAPTSVGVDFGLLEPAEGRPMLERYWRALEASGFSRFDLGVPLNLRPVPREEMEHYTEFQQFLNGGCGVSNTSYLLNALYAVGMSDQADMILDAMLARQSKGIYPNGGAFQNGFRDCMGGAAQRSTTGAGTPPVTRGISSTAGHSCTPCCSGIPNFCRHAARIGPRQPNKPLLATAYSRARTTRVRPAWRTTYWVKVPKPPRHGGSPMIQVNPDGDGFIDSASGRRFVPVGTNYAAMLDMVNYRGQSRNLT
jgi:hypothetical protein